MDRVVGAGLKRSIILSTASLVVSRLALPSVVFLIKLRREVFILCKGFHNWNNSIGQNIKFKAKLEIYSTCQFLRLNYTSVKDNRGAY